MSTAVEQPQEAAPASFAGTTLTTLHEGDESSTTSLGERRQRRTQTIRNYELSKTIGKGNFAKVKLAKHKLTGVEVAIKIVDKTNLKESGLKKVLREIRIMKTLDHPNIVKLYEVIETQTHLFLVMEYASGGEVFDYLVAHGRMKEKDARLRFREIVSALQYCHSKGIVHRDLKAENLLFDKDMHIKIADFGFANLYDSSGVLDTFCGSPPYAAPELFLGKKYIGPEVDAWSLGVILYTLVSGCLPFDGNNVRELRERVLRGKYRVPFYLSQECEALLKKFLHVSPTRRTDLTTVMNDVWMNKDLDQLIPYDHPTQHYDDEERLKIIESFGYSRESVMKSLTEDLYDEVTGLFFLIPFSTKLHQPSSSPSLTRPGSSPSLSVLRNSSTSGTVDTRSQRKPRFQRRHSTVDGGGPRGSPLRTSSDQCRSPQTRQRSITEGGDVEVQDSQGRFFSKMKRGLRQSLRRSSFSQQTSTSDRTRTASVSSEDGTTKPRSLRFTFSMSNTSNKDPSVLVEELIRILKVNQIEYEQTSPFLFTCVHSAIQFEMEVIHLIFSQLIVVQICKLPRLSLNGIRHKRISGPSVGYKNICTKILNELEL